jgi:CHAD domain-containing protein
VVKDATLADLLGLATAAWKRPVRLLERRPTSVTELHDLRLALKHCRYAMEPLADVSPEPAAKLAKALRAAQDSIGEHRDALLADHWVRSNERTLGRPLVERLTAGLAAREPRLRRRARRRSAELLPAWKAWRRATAPVRRAGSKARP